jgi:predicted membrane channel-forming protein YqfA (hemolysin III family)
MAMVRFLNWDDGVPGLQLPLSPPCLPFQTLQFVLLAPRLCWHLPCDSFFIPCSHLLYLLLQPQSTVLLSNLHIGAFDIAGHTHQIFHVFIVQAALSHSAATLVMMRSPACAHVM